jgi:hypothetical protein
MERPADTGLTVLAYTAEPDSPSQDALKLLAGRAATLDQAATATPRTESDPQSQRPRRPGVVHCGAPSQRRTQDRC